MNTQWLGKLDEEKHKRVKAELDRQERALRAVMADKMPKRTARRIIERSRQRIAMIVTGGMT